MKVLVSGMLNNDMQIAKARMHLRRLVAWAKGPRLEYLRQTLRGELSRKTQLRNAQEKKEHLPISPPLTEHKAKKQRLAAADDK